MVNGQWSMVKDKVELLNDIRYPEDLRKLTVDQLPQLCQELRDDIVKELSVNPGHLASSLGVTEITVALHYVYDTPYDRIVWDVGHQAYGHKILTGRKDRFCTNRKLGGLRPFPSPEESEYDTFMCGHASNSISAALGMAVAAKAAKDNRHVVAVIGDGAMSGGLAFEGLNNVSSSDNDILIILNDNNMSIDRAVGGMQEYLLSLNTNETYNALRFKMTRWLHRIGLMEDDRRRGLIRLTDSDLPTQAHAGNGDDRGTRTGIGRVHGKDQRIPAVPAGIQQSDTVLFRSGIPRSRGLDRQATYPALRQKRAQIA